MVTKDTVNTNDNNGSTNTGLIAGLTTGLVMAAIVVLTAGLLIYRKRKRAQLDIKGKPGSVETPPAPMASIISPPLSSITVTAPIATHPSKEAHNIGSPLFIPPLAVTQINPPNQTTIQRSLTLSSKPQMGQSSYSSHINRSSSVKMTKYDYNPPILDDDDLDHVQIRRAISVKRRNAAMAHRASGTPLTSVSRSTSLRSQTTHSRLLEDLPTFETVQDNSEDDDDDLTTAGSGAIQVVCAKPTIARIRSISRKDSKKAATSSDNSSSPIERRSMPSSTHSSTLADGEITVYWQPPSN